MTIFVIGYYLFILNLDVVFGLGVAVVLSKALLVLSTIWGAASRSFIKGAAPFLLPVLFVVILNPFIINNKNFSIDVWVRALNTVIVPIVFLIIKHKESEVKKFLFYMSVAPMFSVAIGFIYNLVGLRDLFGSEYLSGTVRLQGSMIPAFLAGVTMCGAVSSLIFADRYREKYYLLLVNIVILLLTAARMPLLVCSLIIIYYVVFSDRFNLFMKLGIIMIGGVLFSLFLTLFGGSLLSRLSSSGSSGRDILWNVYIDTLSNNWISGVGLGHASFTVPEYMLAETGGVVAPHNEFIRLSVEMGVPGAVIYLISFLGIQYVIAKHAHTKRGLVMVGFIGFMLLCYTDNAFLTPVDYPLILIIATCAIRSSQKEKTKTYIGSGI